MSLPDALNGRPVAAAVDGSLQRGSFVVFGRGLGPSPLTDPAFAHHANSELVDTSREYEYPSQYQHLKPLGLISAVGFGCCWLFNSKDMLQVPEFALVAVVGFLATCFGGFFFVCVNCAHFFSAPVSPPQLLSRTELRHLLGTTACTFWTILLLLAGALKHFVSGGSQRWLEVQLFLVESLGAIVILVPAWYIVNHFSTEPVKAGLIMSMFWSGAIFSAGFAGIFNTILLKIWRSEDPECNAELPVGPKWPFEPASGDCVAKANLEWVLTPGIVEESLKFMVLLRLVTSLEEAMKSKALTRFPRMSSIPCMPCCGWFLKFAASPAVVVLCGMASGAGFGSLENVQYVAKLSGLVKETGSILPASVFSKTGQLASCVCEGEVNESTRKCESNSTADATEVLNNMPRIALDDWEDVRLEVVDAKNVGWKLPSQVQGWYRGTVPKVVDGVHQGLGSNGYVCGPEVVEWWPGPWTSWLLGIGIIALFSVLACCVLPFVEKDFHARRQAAATEAANRGGQLVQMA